MLALVLGATAVVAASPPAGAVGGCPLAIEIIVDELIDDDGTTTPGLCSLREAVETANAQGGAVSIRLGPGVHDLNLGELVVVDDITITGAGAFDTTIDAGGNHRHFRVPSGSVFHVSGVTLIGGNETSDNGGSLHVEGAAVVEETVIDGNHSDLHGGGIHVAGASASLDLRRSTLSDNTSVLEGGAIDHSRAAMVVSDSTFTGNEGEDGGAMVTRWQDNGDIIVENSTIVANHATDNTGGIVPINLSTVVVRNSILAANTSNGSRTDCNEGVVSGDHNVFGDCGIDVTFQPNDIDLMGGAVLSSLVEPLADWGGPTPTMPLAVGSVALEAGNTLAPGSGAPACSLLDQRRVARPLGTTCDAGAVEGTAVPVVEPVGGVILEGDVGTTVGTVRLDLSHASTSTVTVDWATVDAPGEPVDGVDYVAASGTATFLPGETTTTVPITVIGDTLDEFQALNSEWGGILLSNPTNAVVGGGFLENIAFFLILDDDPPRVIADGGSVTEGTGGTTTLDFEFTLTTASAATITVDWETVDNLPEPQPGLDYVSASGTATFLPGETSTTVPITIVGDALVEPGAGFGAEWGQVRMTGAVNATIGTGLLENIGFFFIFDDD